MLAASIHHPPSTILNPFITYDPIQEKKSNTLWSTAWKIASLFSAFCSTTIAVLAVTLTSLYWPIHLPIISLIVFAGGIPSSFQVFKYFWDKSTTCAQEAKIDAKLIEIASNWNEKSLEHRLNTIGIAPPIKPVKLCYAYARYLYLLEQKEKNLERAKTFAPAQKSLSLIINRKPLEISPQQYSLDKVDFSKKEDVAIFEALQRKRAERENYLQEAALCNLKASYLFQIMKKPNEMRPIYEFFLLKNVSYPMRLVCKDYKDAKFDAFVQTSKKNYTISELIEKKPQVLSHEIFSESRSWLW